VQSSRPKPPDLTPSETFDAGFIARTEAFTVDEVLQKLVPTLPGAQQVVLINGQESLVDPATLPAEMIDHIEVNTSGVRPDGRPRVAGTVINIILKNNYNGAGVSGRSRGSFAGGGGQDQMNGWGSFNSGKFSGRFNALHRTQDTLLASERSFSREQNHVAEGGRDYRLQYGTPAVVQAASGTLHGVVDGNGVPVSVALVPASGDPLTPGDFIPGPADAANAAGLRQFNTSDFLYLAAPSEQDSLNGEIGYALTEKSRVRVGYSFSQSDSKQSGPPPVTPASDDTLVPAALNPFGQDLEIGLVHTGFGPVQRATTSRRSGAFLAGDGKLGETWSWNGRFEANHRTLESETQDLDPAKFAAALRSTDPATHFDPFASVGPGSTNAALYPALTRIRRSDGVTDDTRFRLRSQGQVGKGWIAPLQLNIGFERGGTDSTQNLDAGDLTAPDQDTRNRLERTRVFANFDMPVFKVRPLASPAVFSVSSYASQEQQHLDDQDFEIDTLTLNHTLSVPWFEPGDEKRGLYQLATTIGAGATRSEGTTSAIENAGIMWSPIKPVTLRLDYMRQRAPLPLGQYAFSIDYNQTLVDRLRIDPVADDVRVVSGQPDATAPPLSSHTQVALELSPPALEKLKLTLAYFSTEQEGQQRTFTAQDILDNEAALPGRVTRLPPTPEEIAAGQPGRVVQVDITPFSGGKRTDRNLAFMTQYSHTSERLGLITLRAMALSRLGSSNELVAGTQVVSTSDAESPPRSNVFAQGDWQLGRWSAGSTFSRAGGGRYAGIAYDPFATLDARISYQFDKPFGNWVAKSLKVGLGIQNIFDSDPPFADTLTGFRGGSALGRTYELTLRAPLGN